MSDISIILPDNGGLRSDTPAWRYTRAASAICTGMVAAGALVMIGVEAVEAVRPGINEIANVAKSVYSTSFPALLQHCSKQ